MSDTEALKKEISELRGALVHVCDTYSSQYEERRNVRMIRKHANKLSVPFSLDNVNTELAPNQDANKALVTALEDAISHNTHLSASGLTVVVIRTLLDPKTAKTLRKLIDDTIE